MGHQHQSPSPGSNSGTLTAPNSVGSNSSDSSFTAAGGAGATARPKEEQDRVQAIQKLQFHDFPLTTATLSRGSAAPTITQAKILADRQLDLLRLQVIAHLKLQEEDLAVTWSHSVLTVLVSISIVKIPVPVLHSVFF